MDNPLLIVMQEAFQTSELSLRVKKCGGEAEIVIYL